MGDLNVVRFSDKKVGGKTLSIRQLEDLNECMNFCTLSHIRSIGGSWTWNNKVFGGKHNIWINANDS